MLQVCQVAVGHSGTQAGFNLRQLLDVAGHTRIGFPVHRFVKVITEALAGFGDLFIDLALNFLHMLLDEDVGPETALAVFIVDQWIVEGIHVAGSLPGLGMHENGRVKPDDIVVHLHHAFPPIILEVIFELNTIGAVIIYGAQAIVYFAGLVNKAILFAVGYQFFEQIVLLCHSFLIDYTRLYAVAPPVFEPAKVVKTSLIRN